MTKFQDVVAPYTTYSEEAAPTTPAAGEGALYFGADKALHVVDDTGTDTALGAGGGGGAVATDTIFDAKGDLPVGTGTDTAAKLTVGANGTILSADSGEATGLKWIANNAATVTVADAGGDTTTFPMLATAATGALGPATDAGLTYNAATNVLTAGGFAGPLTGNVTGNVTGNADTVTTNANLTGPVTSIGNATTIADAELAAIAGLTSAANKVPYFTGAGTAAVADFDAVGRAIVAPSDALGAVDKLSYVIGAGTGATAALTSFGRGVLAAASNAAIVDLIGGAASVGTGGLVRASAAGGLSRGQVYALAHNNVFN